MVQATVLTAPNTLPEEEIKKYRHRIFLAGGIFGCPDWQAQAISEFQSYEWGEYELLIMSPRRAKFEKTDRALEEQVTWEYIHLNQHTNVYWFWFPMETVCPITLYELGRATNDHRKLPMFVGFHPEYSRRRTLEFQLKLARPDSMRSLDLAEQVRFIHTFIEKHRSY